MTLHVDHAHSLIEAAEHRGLTLIAAFNRHFEPPFTKARELIESREIGDLRLIDTYIAYDWDLWSSPPQTRFSGSASHMLDGVSEAQATLLRETSFRGRAADNGGGFFADGGAPVVDACLWLARSPAKMVFAQMDSPQWDLYSALSLRLASGVLCSIVCIGDAPKPRDFAFHVYGTTGTIHMRWNALILERELHDPIEFDNNTMPTAGHAACNFIDVILGQASPRATALDGLRQVKVTEAAYRSAREGAPVRC